MSNRTIVGLILIFVGLFYKTVISDIDINSKLEKPEQEIIDLVKSLPKIPNNVDSNKLSGLFYAISTKILSSGLNSNLQIQYFLDFVGKNTVGTELKGKYPDFAPATANLISKVVGAQTETVPLTEEEKTKLSKLFYGLAWKLYSSQEDEVFEKYKNLALKSISEYNKDDDKPDDEDCPCNGTGYITHGDGHRTKCPCEICTCKKTSSHKSCDCDGKENCSCTDCECEQCKKILKSYNCMCDTDTTHCGCVNKYGKCSCPTLKNDQNENSVCTDGSCNLQSYSRRGIFGWRK